MCASCFGVGEGRTNRVLAPQTCFREEEEKEEEGRNEVDVERDRSMPA